METEFSSTLKLNETLVTGKHSNRKRKRLNEKASRAADHQRLHLERRRRVKVEVRAHMLMPTDTSLSVSDVTT